MWSGNGNTHYEGARSDRNGRANTGAIASTGTSAVQVCKDLGTGWYLPAYEELVNMSAGEGVIIRPLNGLAGANLLTAPNLGHWSSTEYYNNGGRETSSTTSDQKSACVGYTQGFADHLTKSYQLPVRCVWRD
jgi:hypothetical protein